ncbi:MAG: glycosyltransferase [Patescibacteria group bacterium]
MGQKLKLVSLIIPAYKQERTIERDLKRIVKVMDQIRYNYEIIVVVDGELDNTTNIIKKIKLPRVIVTGYGENHGKGYAIRYGMQKASGDIIAFIDSGMDINPNGLSMLLEHFEWYHADIIVGSKLHPVSKIHYPMQRRVLSWGYRLLVKILFGLKIRDTQAGLKFYKREVLEDVLPRLVVEKYAFDIELLAVAYSLGYKRIYEAPIELDFTGYSSITSKNFWHTVTNMVIDTFIVFYRLKIRKCYNRRKNAAYA